ncbi:thrombospondin type 3 repeat-containing protein [Patescibacteria group bacterium]|nr:thrombospondin type 3 repeat-containing protein [Patescibacteria group bacterium]
MKIRNVKTSLLVLVGLIVISLAFYVSAEDNFGSKNNIFLDSDQDGLSDEEEKSLGTDPKNKDTDGDGYSDGVEVKSGYDPLKPAPGDKLVNEAEKKIAPVVAVNANEKNSTQVMAQKIAVLSNESSDKGEMISQEDVQTLVDESMLASANQEIKLPEIKKEALKILKQDYKKYSKEKAEAKRKEDFSNYLMTVFYIFSNNSPKPITSNVNLSGVINSLFQEVIKAITLRNPASLEKINVSVEKIQEQLMEIEVPEELVDMHIRVIQFSRYSLEAEKLLAPQNEDPIMDIANLSQLAALATEFQSFSSEMEAKFSEYGLTYDENLQKKIEDLGIELPKDLQADLEKNTAENK